MPPLFYAVAFAVSLIGAVIQAVCGFGYGPLNMSLLPYLFPYAQAARRPPFSCSLLVSGTLAGRLCCLASSRQ